MIMPFGDFNIKNIIIKILNVFKILGEHSLKFQKVLSVLWSFGATKDWHNLVGSFSCELKLTLADFHQVLASLDEGFVLSEDGLIGIEVPILFGGVFLDHVLVLEANLFPFFAAVDAFLEIKHAFLNVTGKHVIFVNLCSASLDDLVANLGKETLHSFWSVVENTELPDYTDSH